LPDLSQRLQDALADRYRIERELGRGGMATVYLAEDLKHHRRVAIKVLDPEVASAIGPERFLHEIETVAGLTHPHILPLFDSGQADGLLFYAMPFVEGESLRDRLTREKQLPVEDALRIAREVADALSYAHSHGVVHRDIKPENILLQSGHAVVADFGIARAVAVAGGAALTGTGIAVGTPAYMSPEQAAGSRDLDGRSDLYSLGCVLYEMLAGVPPFAGTTAESLAHQHLNLAPRPITELRPAVPAAVAAALQRALAKVPADRFNPVAQFGEALGPAGTGTVVAAAPIAMTTSTKPRRGLLLLGVAAIVVAVVAGALFLRGQHKAPPAPTVPAHGRTEIAVLPLQNLSAGGPHAYFAGGLHDELLTQLAKVAALKVISRTSVMGYAGTTKPLRQIAAELGVGSIVEGTVQVEGQRLRVTVQLIDAATDEHLWAERYDRTLDDAFAIQSDVAQQIVKAVGAALAVGERQAIIEAPTKNPEAYRLYLQGQDYQVRPTNAGDNLKYSQQSYERALAIDPKFALAHAALSRTHGWLYWYSYDPFPARAAQMRKEAEIALRLAPGLPEAHVAMGLAHYWGHRDYRRALEEFRIALRARPGDAWAWLFTGAVERRLGDWAGAVTAMQNSARLNPRDANMLGDLGMTYHAIHRYSEAIRAWDRSLALAPDYHESAVNRGYCLLAQTGNLRPLQIAISGLPPMTDLGSAGIAISNSSYLYLLKRKPDSLLTGLRAVPPNMYDVSMGFQPHLFAGWAHRMQGDRASARAAFQQALEVLDTVRVGNGPDSWRIHGAKGLTLAGLGRTQEALEEAQQLKETVVYREDAFSGPSAAEARAMVLAQAGEADAAMNEIERLLIGPSWGSVHTLRLDPRWDPIRNHPRFKALLLKYANPEKSAPVREK
jgi:eukaryotic-like serine/threonine-protein kinase